MLPWALAGLRLPTPGGQGRAEGTLLGRVSLPVFPWLDVGLELVGPCCLGFIGWLRGSED